MIHLDKTKGPKDKSHEETENIKKEIEKDAAFQEALRVKRMAKFQGLQAESIDNDGWMIGRVNYDAEYEAYKREQEKSKNAIKKQK